jgi:hypothetical protein
MFWGRRAGKEGGGGAWGTTYDFVGVCCGVVGSKENSALACAFCVGEGVDVDDRELRCSVLLYLLPIVNSMRRSSMGRCACALLAQPSIDAFEI